MLFVSPIRMNVYNFCAPPNCLVENKIYHPYGSKLFSQKLTHTHPSKHINLKAYVLLLFYGQLQAYTNI